MVPCNIYVNIKHQVSKTFTHKFQNHLQIGVTLSHFTNSHFAITEFDHTRTCELNLYLLNIPWRKITLELNIFILIVQFSLQFYSRFLETVLVRQCFPRFQIKNA